LTSFTIILSLALPCVDLPRPASLPAAFLEKTGDILGTTQVNNTPHQHRHQHQQHQHYHQLQQQHRSRHSSVGKAKRLVFFFAIVFYQYFHSAVGAL
jgi:hypothetical protein